MGVQGRRLGEEVGSGRCDAVPRNLSSFLEDDTILSC